ncbi:hypothetical protein EYF80_036795 [Liparis tanakae]|uniref:Uncharacterized protein n=1 Tax=Liparis tanakae TaxID=230148 RepID=A0A4Z2GHS9_9TELE|nr:hypothetical protein EYF80_036795 [Liparis tanakae]
MLRLSSSSRTQSSFTHTASGPGSLSPAGGRAERGTLWHRHSELARASSHSRMGVEQLQFRSFPPPNPAHCHASLQKSQLGLICPDHLQLA